MTRRSDRAVLALTVALILTPALVKLLFYPAYPGPDDAFIHVAVAEHILHGDGWGIASNGRVNLSSSPLFTVLVVPVLAIGSIGFAQALTVVFACAAMAVTFFTTRRFTSSKTCGLVALVVAASNVHLWRWSGTVMETTLAYLIVTIIAAATLRLIQPPRTNVSTFVALGVLIGIGTLVRFEIAVLLPLSMLAIALSSRSGLTRLGAAVGGFVVAVIPWLVFSTIYFGTPIPTTFLAKAGGFHLANAGAAKVIGVDALVGSGASFALAAVALAVACRSPEGRSKLRASVLPLVFLVGWPVVLFAFYYLRMSGALISARYVLMGMATWPIAVGLIISSVPRHRHDRTWLAIASIGCVAVALVINVVKVAPVLRAFDGGYREAMHHGADYLRANCRPGDVALIDFDIGILARDGIGACRLVDFGALATPELRGMTLAQALSRVKPTYLVQTTGQDRDELATEYAGLTLQLAESYTDRGVANDHREYLNVYRVAP